MQFQGKLAVPHGHAMIISRHEVNFVLARLIDSLRKLVPATSTVYVAIAAPSDTLSEVQRHVYN